MEEEKRTTQQNKSLWLWFTLLAEKLNDAGLDMRVLLKEGIDIPWNKQTIHDFIWKPVQKALLQKDSTTKLLKKEEIDKVFDTLTRHLGTKFGVYQEFPSIEHLIEEERTKEQEKKLRDYYANE